MLGLLATSWTPCAGRSPRANPMRGLNMGRRVAALAALAAAQTAISTMSATTTGLRRSTLPRTAPPYRTARGAAQRAARAQR